MDSLYWVLSRNCNNQCSHCYNYSQPGGPGLSHDVAAACVGHLPDPRDVPVGRIILSGGEPLVWPDLLAHALDLLHERYGDSTPLWIQTNGDQLDEAMLDFLLEHHVARIDVSSMDAFHAGNTPGRQETLTQLFESRGMHGASDEPAGPAYAFWGANPDTWIGAVWPRGRARHAISKATPEDRFCAEWSGAIRFLDYSRDGSEVNIQLSDVYPCCPMTIGALGDLLEEPLITILDRCAGHPVFQSLNRGNPEGMGETMGLSEAYGYARSRALGNHCLWCDEFFRRHAPDLLRTPRWPMR